MFDLVAREFFFYYFIFYSIFRNIGFRQRVKMSCFCSSVVLGGLARNAGTAFHSICVYNVLVCVYNHKVNMRFILPRVLTELKLILVLVLFWTSMCPIDLNFHFNNHPFVLLELRLMV